MWCQASSLGISVGKEAPCLMWESSLGSWRYLVYFAGAPLWTGIGKNSLYIDGLHGHTVCQKIDLSEVLAVQGPKPQLSFLEMLCTTMKSAVGSSWKYFCSNVLTSSSALLFGLWMCHKVFCFLIPIAHLCAFQSGAWGVSAIASELGNFSWWEGSCRGLPLFAFSTYSWHCY